MRMSDWLFRLLWAEILLCVVILVAGLVMWAVR